MQIEQSLIYIIILIFTVLTLFLLGILVAYLRMIRKYLDLKEGKDRYPDPKILLLRAHAKSQKIIEDATDKASQIVSSTEMLKTRNLDSIQKQIEKAELNNFKLYQDSISKIQNESLKVLQNVPEYIRALLSKEVLVVKDNLLSEINKAQENARALITQAYSKADSEVAVYKKMRISALDKTIVSIVEQVSRKVLNKEIDMSEHEKLVIKALEETKRLNVFSEEAEENQSQVDQQNKGGP